MSRRVVSCAFVLALAAAGLASGGAPGTMPVYYDGEPFTMNLMELPETAAHTIIAENPSFNTLYEADGCEPGGAEFVMVIDAIQGDGFNPLWREVQISFTAGHPCRQLTGDEEIDAAVESGEITLTPTDEVYRCSVIGPRH
jgi:hypothetical protein